VQEEADLFSQRAGVGLGVMHGRRIHNQTWTSHPGSVPRRARRPPAGRTHCVLARCVQARGGAGQPWPASPHELSVDRENAYNKRITFIRGLASFRMAGSSMRW
jgi:hypothetical protein